METTRRTRKALVCGLDLFELVATVEPLDFPAAMPGPGQESVHKDKLHGGGGGEDFTALAASDVPLADALAERWPILAEDAKKIPVRFRTDGMFFTGGRLRHFSVRSAPLRSMA